MDDKGELQLKDLESAFTKDLREKLGRLEEVARVFNDGMRAECERLALAFEKAFGRYDGEDSSPSLDKPQWGTWETVDEVGWYWWICGSRNSTLVPTFVKCIYDIYGEAVFFARDVENNPDVEDIGGHWMKIAEPEYESILGALKTV